MDTITQIGLAFLMFSLGTYEYIKLQRFLRTGVKAKGRRTGFTIVVDRDNDKMQVPVLEFIDSNDKIVQTEIDTNIHNKRREIDIVYDPKNPKDVIADYWTKHIPWLSFMTFGLLILMFLWIKLASR